jgi:N-acyl-D-aspartate/D-glutamate deacylase
MSATRKHLIIRGGLVLNAHAAREKPVALDILIVDDKIAELAPAGEAFATPIDPSVPPETLDARDRLIVPGFVDAVRLYGPHAVLKDVGLALLEYACQARTGSRDSDGCWPNLI